MDSGNSGSLQSSSGGDDEFDSRGAGGGVDSSPLSALLRPSPSPSAAAFSLHGPYFGLQEFTSAPPPHHQPQPQPGAWSSGSSFPGAASGLPSSSSSPRVDSGAGARQQQAADTTTAAAAQGQGAAMGGPAAQQPPPRASRKRTRASRRAPTTVLTTDTSNFRAMVQEFTGIPSPPFGAGVGVGIGGPGASSLRTRFDHIFPPPSSSLRSAAAGDATASLPPYLLRPFPQKLPTMPSSSSFPSFTTTTSSSSSAPSSSNLGVANANATTGTAATAAAAPSNPVAPAGETFSSALLRLQQQDPSGYLSFQNLLDSQQPPSQSIFGAAAGGFGHGHGQASSSRLHDPAPSPSDFLASVGGSGSLGGLAHHGGLLGSEGLHLHHSSRGGDELSGVVAAGASGGSCKLNYSSHAGAGTSSSGAGSADKPPDGGGGGAAAGRQPGRGEGQLDPWICTSE